MHQLLTALAFLIEVITVGGIAAAILTLVGFVPIQVTRTIEIHVDDANKATEILKSWGLSVAEMEVGEDDEEPP